MKSILLGCTAILAFHNPRLSAAPLQLNSPDGKLTVGLAATDSGTFGYTLEAQGTPLISHSALGLDFGSAGKAPASGWKIAVSQTRSVNSTWKPLWGKRTLVPDRYRETTVELTGPGAPFDRITLTARAYDDGIAFRYSIPADAKGKPPKPPANSPNSTSRVTSPPGSTTTNSTTSARTNSAPSRATANRS